MTIPATDEKNIAAPGWFMEWWPVFAGLLVLFIPTYYTFITSVWSSEDQAHGPIVLAVVLFLFWQQRHFFLSGASAIAQPTFANGVTATGKSNWSMSLGWSTLAFGLFCYVIGHSQGIRILDIGSQIPILAGVLLIMRGASVLRAMWFPLFFMLFMIPLPGFFLDAVTLPMKMAVSHVAEQVLYWFDYPVARSGVILQIGQYQLLVADACAGMHTLISLEALGLLYLNLVKHDSLFRNISLALLIIPISFAANVIRVITLTLVTYYFGDEVGQGFVHGFAGMLLFIVALIIILAVDSALQFGVRWRQAFRAAPAAA